MPSSQTQNGLNGQPSNTINKPPPNKPPPPPPPPPKTIRPPPPRNSNQMLGPVPISNNQICCLSTPNVNGSGMLNSGPSIGLLNSAGRCNCAPSIGTTPVSINHGQRNFIKHDNCSSRSSVSSHNSLQHHHHSANNGNGNSAFPSSCHQNSMSMTSCLNSTAQCTYASSSGLSDNGSCNQENRSFLPISSNTCCTPNSNHHLHSSKCQAPSVNPNANARTNNLNGPSTTTISRNALFFNAENANTGPVISGCVNEQRSHCIGSHPHHHHHHHNMHSPQLLSSSSLSSLQPVDANNSFHRFNMSQSNTVNSVAGLLNDQSQRPQNVIYCNHAHRSNGCNHHHSTNFCDHHPQSVCQQQIPHDNCSMLHHGCNSSMLMDKNCAPIMHHHCPQELIVNRSSDASNNDSLLSTAHTHNLSNSSTTTHTSNVAVKHQPQFQPQPATARDGRASSQQYDQYGPSSAASTSSATASLSNYQAPAGFEDHRRGVIPLYPTSHQSIPPIPTSKSRPASPSQQLMISNNSNNNNNSIITTTFISGSQPQQNFNSPLPPLPPKHSKPVFTNVTLSSNPTTTTNQPITRVTSQAGVQNPLPNSDVPPPLPPLNPGSRTQPLVNTLMTRMHNSNDILPPLDPIPSFSNLNINRNNSVSESERKMEALNRQIELEFEPPKPPDEQHGTCTKCGTKVLPAQEACKAMNQIFHANCFVCCKCNRPLLGKTFYPVGDKVYCEEDFKFTGHLHSLEKCAACLQPIYNMILPAMGKSYHPKCFKCCICDQCLDGVRFTIDVKNKIYCVKDYHSIYSPKCAACGKSISPIDETGETVRVVSMDKDYHIDCYCCEDCGLQLTDEEPSQSYPLDNHLLCQQCHINRLSKIQANLSV